MSVALLALIFLQGSATTTEGEVFFQEETTAEPSVVEQYESCVGLMFDVLTELECSRHDHRITIKTDSFERFCECVEKAREMKQEIQDNTAYH